MRYSQRRELLSVSLLIELRSVIGAQNERKAATRVIGLNYGWPFYGEKNTESWVGAVVCIRYSMQLGIAPECSKGWLFDGKKYDFVILFSFIF